MLTSFPCCFHLQAAYLEALPRRSLLHFTSCANIILNINLEYAPQAAYLEALRGGPPPATASEAEAQRSAEAAMTGEANALLTQAGVMFIKVRPKAGPSHNYLVSSACCMPDTPPGKRN